MARPNKQAERKAQILNAMGRVVARYGIAGVTLEKVAAEAGLARALVRHNVGNREKLIVEFTNFYLERSEQASSDMFTALPDEAAASVLVEGLFDPQYAEPQAVLIAEALIAAGADDPELADRMRAWTMNFITRVETVLQTDCPNAPGDRVKAVAAGIVGIYFNVDSMSPLGDMTDLRTASRDAAFLLLKSLEV